MFERNYPHLAETEMHDNLSYTAIQKLQNLDRKIENQRENIKYA